MPANVEITEALIREQIVRAITDVFKIMLAREPVFAGKAEQTPDDQAVAIDSQRPQVVGTVGFIGDLNGIVYLHLDLAFAKFCTRHLLDITEAELNSAGDEAINDAIGELT